jgi:TetR/AcrR family transcriptional repressor of bet genes
VSLSGKVAELALAQNVTRKPRKERKENADRRRRQLLDAARRSVVKHGLGRTTLATVADEAGLSQGVAVFYFKSKGGLLTETLRDLYQQYETLWMSARDGAGDDHEEQLRALIEADFSAPACSADVLAVWFAFWGELRFTTHYAEVAGEFDARRRAALEEIWSALLSQKDRAEVIRLAEWTDTLTDGYWQRLHLAPDSLDREAARAATLQCLGRLVPALAQTLVDP